MQHLALEDFDLENGKMDSLYRLVVIAARRAIQLNKPEARSLVAPVSKKPVTLALEEILEGKVWYRIGGEDEDEYDVG